MCLLKPGQSNAFCCHKECKSYYTLNNQGCLHQTALLQAKNRDSDEDSPNQTQTTYSPDKSSVSSLKISPSNSKRHISFDSENIEEILNKKKVKSDGKPLPKIKHNIFLERKVSEEDLIPPLNNFNQAHSNMMNQFQTNYSIPTLDTSSLLNNNSILSRLACENLLNNKLNLLSTLQKLQSASAPYEQNLGLLSNNHFGINSTYSQAPLQINKISNECFSQAFSGVQENKASNTSFEESMRGFQSKTMEILSSQQVMLSDLSQKHDLIRDTLACLINEVSSLK